MTRHKIEAETEPSRRMEYWLVTMTCTCGETFEGTARDTGRSDDRRLRKIAKDKAETAFRAHIPIR